MAPRISRSPRRVGALVAALGAVGALAMALLPSAFAATPTITLNKPGSYGTSTNFTGGDPSKTNLPVPQQWPLYSGSCAGVGVPGTFLFGGSMANRASLTNPFPTLAGSGLGGSGTTTDALRYVKLTLDGTYTVTGIVVVAYPNIYAGFAKYHYYIYSGAPAGPVIIEKLVAPTVGNQTYQTNGYTVIKRWFVCGTPAAAPTTAPVATTTSAVAVPTTTAARPPTTQPAPTTTAPATTAPATTPPTTTPPTTPPTSAPGTTTPATTGPATTASASSPTPAVITGLARTGQNLSGVLWVGAALLLAGVAALLFVTDRRARQRRTDPDAGTS